MKMKKKSLFLLSVASLMMLASCNEKSTPSSSSVSSSEENVSSVSSSEEVLESISIAKAIEIANASGESESKAYLITAIVKEITNYQYGDMTIGDDKDSISIFRFRGSDGSTIYEKLTDKPRVGDEITVKATLNTHNGTPQIKVALLQSVKHNESTTDFSKYTSQTIAAARELKAGKKVLLEGVVAAYTYADGMYKTGFYLIDSTSSMYVRSEEVASQVSVGNKIQVAGSINYWILDSEKNNAEKYEYTGSLQITDCILKSNDNGKSSFDKSWVTETTIKKMMNTEFNENVTNKVFKVSSLVKKSVGTGFVNYYFDDIDGKTGSYAYTQNSGADFSWLDEFDGKICTVYLTAINAKSSASGCNWRFFPIEVSDDNYVFDKTDVGEYVWEYHIKDLFRSKYTGDPLLNVPTSVSSTLLGFENATVSYSSSDTSVGYFTDSTDGSANKVFRVNANNGTTTVTATIKYGTNKEYVQTLDIRSVDPGTIASLTVKQAIEATPYDSASETNQKIVVKGVAGPSLVNKTGFYLIDDTGAIAVRVAAKVMRDIELGQEVILEGYRKDEGAGTLSKKDGSTWECGGQICLDDVELLANLYGSHSYSTASFVSGKTITELYNTPVATKASAQVYTLTASVKITKSAYYSNIFLTDGTTDLRLYSSSANQYSDFAGLDGQEVSVELALCNWNQKNYYTGCLLSATSGENKILNKYNYNIY